LPIHFDPEPVMTTLIRPKHPTIYGQCANFWQGGPVWFVAHIVRTGGAVSTVAAASSDGSGHPASKHPDQKYWNSINRLNLTNVARIEFDCTLMPCNEHGDNSCLFVLPHMMATYGAVNVPIRFFAHRNEGLGDSAVQRDNKRYINCNSNMNNAALRDAYAAHQHWTWAPMPKADDPRTYDQF
jgi:hypothetical protein